jgi:hypothetical protein
MKAKSLGSAVLPRWYSNGERAAQPQPPQRRTQRSAPESNQSLLIPARRLIACFAFVDLVLVAN